MSTKSRDKKSASGVTRKSLQGGSALIIGLVAVVATALLVAGIGKMVQARTTVTFQSLIDAQALYAAETAFIRADEGEFNSEIRYWWYAPGKEYGNKKVGEDICEIFDDPDKPDDLAGAKLAVGKVNDQAVHRICGVQPEQSVLYIDGEEKFTPPERGGSLSILGGSDASLKFPGAPASSYDTLCSDVGGIDMPGSQSGKLPFAQGHFVCQEDKPRKCEETILGVKGGNKVFDSDDEFGDQNKICRDAICFHRDVGSWPAECPMGPPSPKYTEWEYAR